MKYIKYVLGVLVMMFLFSSSCTYKNIYNTDTIKQIPLEEFMANTLNNDSVIIIDVRTPVEFNASHYPNAINVNMLKSFKKDIKNLDNTKTVYLYCETAHRSPFATRFLKQQGFTEIYDLDKGFSQYKKYLKRK